MLTEACFIISLLRFLDQGFIIAPVCISIKILGFDVQANKYRYTMAMKAQDIGGLWQIIILGLSFLSIFKVLINNTGRQIRGEVNRKCSEAPICLEIP